jgi:hypothetical protein
MEVQPPNFRHQQPQLDDVAPKAAFLLVLQHELRRRLLERTSRPDAVHLRLTSLFHHSREVPLGFLELSLLND